MISTRRHARPIRWWLATFGSAVALPFIILLGLMFAIEIRTERDNARTTALRVSRAASGRLLGLRADSLMLLEHMATRPAIHNFDTQACDSLFPVVDLFPQYANLFLFSADGRLLCSANPQDRDDRLISEAALRWLQDQSKPDRLKPAVLTMHQTAGRWVSTLSVPVRSASGKRATLTLVALPDIVEKEALPAEAVVTIADQKGIILARSADYARWAGHSARGRGVILQREGTVEATGIDGISRQYGFTFVPQLRWYISVGIPNAELMQPVRRLYIRGLIAGLLVIFVAVGVALLLARRVEAPINELAAGASAVAHGSYKKVEPPQKSPLEIAVLADAFNEMVESRSESEQRLKKLSERLLEIQEDERARIARAIHDDLGQSLTALKMDLLGLIDKNKIPPSPIRERIQLTLDNTVTAVQQIAKELRPSTLDDLGLIPTLEADVRLFEERTGIECELSLPTIPLSLDGVSSTALYRIIQEALTNVVRHSNASRVEIHMQQVDGDVFLEIRDDGRGITSDEVSSPASLGLIGIRERAAIIGGTAEFEGSSGRGTIVSVHVPASDRVGAAS